MFDKFKCFIGMHDWMSEGRRYFGVETHRGRNVRVYQTNHRCMVCGKIRQGYVYPGVKSK